MGRYPDHPYDTVTEVLNDFNLLPNVIKCIRTMNIIIYCDCKLHIGILDSFHSIAYIMIPTIRFEILKFTHTC